MSIREFVEKREYEILSEHASKSAEAVRRVPEEPCDIRTSYQRDRDRIIHSKSFRRLMHKTQVFLSPEGDHFRTRLTHTIEVSQIARTIARALQLNEDLTEAIAMGHDLGHTPFGHNGEFILNKIHENGFRHNVQSLRVVDVIEIHNGSRGMNLTEQVRDGIVNHTGPVKPFTMEGQIVKISDRIAYINHDIDDAIRSGVIRQEDLPEDCISMLGATHGTRIDTLVKDIITNSRGQGEIIQSDECEKHMNQLRKFMFENVYHSPRVKRDEEINKVASIIEALYAYFREHTDKLPTDCRGLLDEWGPDEVAKDYVAGMTDRYSVKVYEDLFIPRSWI